jgi:diguanylate cyclase (GGDEF)-like protein/PAS domain S-box-containing protein
MGGVMVWIKNRERRLHFRFDALRHWFLARASLVVLLLFLIGVWSLALYASRVLRSDMQALLGEQQAASVAMLAEGIHSQVKERRAALELVASNIDAALLKQPAVLQKQLEQRPIFLTLFNAGVFVTRLDGTAVAEAPKIGRIGLNYLDRDHIDAALQEGKATIGKAVVGKRVRAASFAMTVPIRNARGEVIGALAGATDLSKPNFLDSFNAGRYGKTGGYLIIDPEHRLFVTATANNTDLIMQPLPAAGVNPVLDRRLLGFDGQTVSVNSRGTEVLGASARIPSAGWLVLATLPTQEAFAPIATMERRILVATLLLSVLASALVWLRMQMGRQGQQLAAKEQRFRALFERASDGILLVAASGRIVSVNEAFAHMHGYTVQQLQTMELSNLDTPETARQIPQRMKQLLANEALHFEVEHVHSNGKVIVLDVSCSAIFDEAEPLIQAFYRDITERKRDEQLIQNLAFTDTLTELPNRRHLIVRLQQALAVSQRHQHHGALLLIDLDDFKTLNDTLGHAQGDRMLEQVAKRLLACVREGDTVARLGGDEFIVMLENLDNDAMQAANQAEAVAEKVLASLNQSYQLNHWTHHGTASIGITLFGDKSESVEVPMIQVDLALYQAKAAGRNTLRFFDARMQLEVSARLALEAALRRAVQNHEFVLYYQVQVDAQHRATGAEALLRWQDPQRGMVSPAEFIPLAERTGLILPLGRWVLETAGRQLALWAKQPELAQLTLAVNVSARQFRQNDFVPQVMQALERSGARPDRLKIELTESLLVANVEDVIKKMSELKERGVGFSLDDFGTGYSSLAYLKRLPLDQLKIDQGFVRDILEDPDDAAIAETVIALARSLELGVIAEGVETEAQCNFLAELGCLAYQGYLFGRPLPIQEFEALVMQQEAFGCRLEK